MLKPQPGHSRFDSRSYCRNIGLHDLLQCRIAGIAVNDSDRLTRKFRLVTDERLNLKMRDKN